MTATAFKSLLEAETLRAKSPVISSDNLLAIALYKIFTFINLPETVDKQTNTAITTASFIFSC